MDRQNSCVLTISNKTQKMKKKILTLVIVRNESDQVLLGFKKRGFGHGKWNGFGGKVEPEETVEDAAKRELQEECGLKAISLDKVGRIEFEFVGDPVIMDVRIFSTRDYIGDPIESEEMRPKWYNLEDMPFDNMWPDDRIWFPWYLRKKIFKAFFLFEGHHKILRYTIQQSDGREITLM